MRPFARIAIALFGIFWFVSGLAAFASATIGFFKYHRFNENPDWTGLWLTGAGISAASVLVFSLIPALLLVAYSGRLSNRLFPDVEAPAFLSPSPAYILGCTLLSLFFIIEGVGSLVGGFVATITMLMADGDSPILGFQLSNFSEMLGSGTVQAVAGILLYRHAARKSEFTPSGEPAT